MTSAARYLGQAVLYALVAATLGYFSAQFDIAADRQRAAVYRTRALADTAVAQPQIGDFRHTCGPTFQITQIGFAALPRVVIRRRHVHASQRINRRHRAMSRRWRVEGPNANGAFAIYNTSHLTFANRQKVLIYS